MEEVANKPTNIFDIPIENFSRFVTKFSKLQKTAEKLKVEIPKYDIIQLGKTVGPTLKDSNIYEFNVVEVFGTSPKFDGFEFVGTIEHTPNGNILRSMKNKDIPVEFSKGDPYCDHCKKIRSRNETFPVEKEGILTRVGCKCIKDFLGHKSPEMIAYMETMVSILEPEEEDEDNYRPRFKNEIHLETFLSFVIASVNFKGWEPKGGTARNAVYHMDSSAETLRKEGIERYKITDEIMAKARECIEFAKNAEATNSFLNNIKIIAGMNTIQDKHLNLAAAIFRAQMNDAEFKAKCAEKNRLREIEKAERLALNIDKEYIGVIGGKVELTVRVIDKIAMENSGYYGAPDTTLIKFLDEKGNELSSFTSTGSRYEIGVTYKIKATVKDHKMFKETKQTILTRIKQV